MFFWFFCLFIAFCLLFWLLPCSLSFVSVSAKFAFLVCVAAEVSQIEIKSEGTAQMRSVLFCRIIPEMRETETAYDYL